MRARICPIMEFKYVIGTGADPYRNLAVEETLMSLVSPSMAILFLWQNANTIVVGRNQDVNKECRAVEFMRDGGRLVRRRSGGGAVYHDLGNLNFSIICHNSRKKACTYQSLVVAALKFFSVTAEFNGRNDLTVAGRKCSGNAAYMDMDVICQHGTLLISSDIEKMDFYLTPDKDKLERNHIASVKSRVINLHTLNSAVTVESMKQALIHSAGAKKMEYIPDEGKIDRLTAFYASNEWIYGGKR